MQSHDSWKLILNFWGWRDQKWQGHCCHFCLGALKLVVSQVGVDGIIWYFAWCCKFRKAKSYLINFWMGVFKNGCGHLSHGTLNLLYFKNKFMKCSVFCMLVIDNFWLDCKSYSATSTLKFLQNCIIRLG